MAAPSRNVDTKTNPSTRGKSREQQGNCQSNSLENEAFFHELAAGKSANTFSSEIGFQRGDNIFGIAPSWMFHCHVFPKCKQELGFRL
jgi:hypothetical protein